MYRGHLAQTTVAKFSPSGYWVSSADITGKVKVWSWDNPEHLTKLETQVFAGAVQDLDWDFESKRIVAVGEGSGMLAKCFVWDTGNSAGEMVGHNKRVLSVAFKPNRPFRIMTGSEDMKTAFYNGPPFKMDHTNPVHTNFVNCVCYSPDGNHVVSVSSDKKIQFYAGSTGQPTVDIPNAHAGTIYSACFSPNNARIATASADKTVKIWDVATASLLWTLQVSSDPQVGDMQVALVWTSTHLVSLSLNGNLNIWDSSLEGIEECNGFPKSVFQNHQVAITALHYDRRDQVLFTSSFDGVIMARNLQTGWSRRIEGTNKKTTNGSVHQGKVSGLAVTGDSLMSVGWDDKIRWGTVSSWSSVEESSLNSQPVAMAVAAHATNIVAILTLKELIVYSNQVESCRCSLDFQPSSALAISADGQEIAVGGEDCRVRILGPQLDQKYVITEGRHVPTALAYSSCGRYLAVGDAGRVLDVYQRDDWSSLVRGKWVFHTSKITTLVWSPNNRYVASGSLDENIFIWDIQSPMEKVQIPFAHNGGVTGVEWLDSQRLVSVGNDHCVVTWKVPELLE